MKYSQIIYLFHAMFLLILFVLPSNNTSLKQKCFALTLFSCLRIKGLHVRDMTSPFMNSSYCLIVTLLTRCCVYRDGIEGRAWNLVKWSRIIVRTCSSYCLFFHYCSIISATIFVLMVLNESDMLSLVIGEETAVSCLRFWEPFISRVPKPPWRISTEEKSTAIFDTNFGDAKK